MTLIPIMIPLQTGQQVLAPEPGTGPRPVLFFDAQKRMFSLRIGLPIAHQRQTSFTYHGILRKHASHKARLYSRLGKQETQRASSSILLSRGRKTAIAGSQFSLQKKTARQTSGGASLFQQTIGKAGGQASIGQIEKAKTAARASLSRREKKQASSQTGVKHRRKNRTESQAEPEDDADLLAALDE